MKNNCNLSFKDFCISMLAWGLLGLLAAKMGI